MNNLKTVRKAKYPIAGDYLKQSALNFNIPAYSLVETGKVLLTPQDMATVCKELQATVSDIYTEPSDYQYEGAEEGKATQSVACEVKELAPEIQRLRELPSNPRLQSRHAPNVIERVESNVRILGYSCWGEFVRKKVLPELERMVAERTEKIG